MSVKRVFINRKPDQVIRIGLEPHINPQMPVGALFSQCMVEILVSRIEEGEARLLMTAPEHLLIEYKNCLF